MALGAPTSPDRGTPGGPAIDRSVLGEWLAGDDAAINELLAVFRDSVCAEQQNMRDALASGDLNEYANAGHRLRGAALSMGAHALADVVGTLQAAAKARDAPTCTDGMTLLQTHIERVVSEVPGPVGSQGERSAGA